MQLVSLNGKRVLLIILTLSVSDSLSKVTSIVARALIGWCKDKDKARRSLTVEDLERANRP